MEHKDVYKLIGKNIKKYRKAKKITQEQLAIKANLSYGFIKNLEAKNVYATISIETLAVIAECLNIPLVKLLEDEEN